MTADVVKIEKAIVGQKVNKPQVEEPQTDKVDDPLEIAIDHRPVGELPAISNKIEMYTQEGPKRIYVMVSFMETCGTVNGEELCVERPLEFFVPPSQATQDQQWISTSMRQLSLIARSAGGNFLAKALADMQKVRWDKGPVRCGVNEYDKPVYHDSEAAAIGWSIQQMLIRRGFLDKTGKPLPAKELAERYALRGKSVLVTTEDTNVPEEGQRKQKVRNGMQIVGTCSQCSGDTVLNEGCEVCVDCGNSKCG